LRENRLRNLIIDIHKHRTCSPLHIVAHNLPNAMTTNPEKFELRNMRAMIPASIKDFEYTLHKANVKPDSAGAVFQLLFLTGLRMKKNPHYAEGVPRETRWRPISSEVVKILAGGRYKKVIKIMIDLQWIEVRKNVKTGKEVFQPDRFTKMYRIHPQLTSENETIEELRAHTITDVYTRRAIMRLSELSKQKRLELMEAKKHLFKPIHRKILEYAEDFKLDETRLVNDILSGDLKDERIEDFIGEAFSFNQRDAIWFTVDEFGKRLHFPLNNLDKKLRPYLYLENKPDVPLVLLDLKNSQPYLLSLLMVYPELISFRVPEFLGLIPLLQKRLNNHDVKVFHYDCYMGEFYQKISGGKKLTTEEKAALKDDLFHFVFYGRPKDTDRPLSKEKKTESHTPSEEDLRKVKANINFKMVYPSVWKNLYYLKKQKNKDYPFFSKIKTNNKDKGRMFTLLNSLAQRFESSIIFEIVERAYEQKIKVVTIHDAFLCEARHSDQLQAIIDDFFIKELKVHPPKVNPEQINNVRQ
jgi:hypothetical protein